MNNNVRTDVFSSFFYAWRESTTHLTLQDTVFEHPVRIFHEQGPG